MTQPPDTATALVVAKILNDKIREARVALNDAGTTAWRVGERKVAELPDGTRIGSVSYAKGRDGTAKVFDERALTAWVAEKFPTEVETITRIRPAYLSKLLNDVRDHGGAFNSSTGEIEDVPGVEVGDGTDPYLTVRADKDAAEWVMAALRSGQLDFREVLQIGAGESK